MRARFARNVFNLSKRAADILKADNSGSARQPLPGSTVPPEKRILRMQHENTFSLLASKSGINVFISQSTNFLEKLIITNGVEDQWVEFPDLFSFIQDLTSKAIINALCGPRLIEKNPGFIESFWTFDLNVHYLNIGILTSFKTDAYNARDQCIQAIIEWKKAAIQDSKNTIYPNSMLWDDIWGLKVMRDRDEMYSRFPEFSDDTTRAGSDLGIIWACNDNLIPLAAWLIHQILESPSLHARCMKAFNQARLPPQAGSVIPRFNTDVLVRNPLLLSVYNEVLRTQATGFISRTAQQDCQIGDYMFPKGSVMIAASWLVHHNPGLWESRPGAENHPVEEFWPERFLVCPRAKSTEDEKFPTLSDEEQEFSLKGLEGTFFPFGTGHNACPGRHFATHAILNMAATLLSTFDFEPVGTWAGKEREFTNFGYTPSRAVKNVAFRIRRNL
ncbi:hypothetical protein FQN49_006220 [Arthroderma sp. PD_2]|nr:hypothetical protein FQN49_006220 [Arthroderma sp. PD_2]